MVVDPFTGAPRPVFRGPLTVQQAADAGFDLSTIVTAVNTATLAENTALKVQLAALQAPNSPDAGSEQEDT